MILGIDYGPSHIGLAISEGSIASPKETLTVNELKTAIKKISQLVADWEIDEIVIGISEGKSKNRAISFGKKLETMLRLKVNFVDETLSSIEALSLKRTDKKREHAASAAIILQRWLDNR